LQSGMKWLEFGEWLKNEAMDMTTVDDLTYFGNSKFGTNFGVNEIGSLVQLLISVSVLGHIMSNPAAILND
jgi:hypothetical protein